MAQALACRVETHLDPCPSVGTSADAWSLYIFRWDGWVCGGAPWAAAGPLAGSGVDGKLESSCAFQDDCSVSLLPAGPPTLAPGAGKAFVTVDRLLDHARTGPWYRRSPPSSSTLSGSARISLGDHPYLEENSVRVGLAEEAERYPWARCLAGEAGRGAGCGPGGPPHRCQTDSLTMYKLQGQAGGLSYSL